MGNVQPGAPGPTELPLIRPSDGAGYPIKTTLIITTKATLNQWQDEARLHIEDSGMAWYELLNTAPTLLCQTPGSSDAAGACTIGTAWRLELQRLQAPWPTSCAQLPPTRPCWGCGGAARARR
jgi:hypothetical protein